MRLLGLFLILTMLLAGCSEEEPEVELLTGDIITTLGDSKQPAEDFQEPAEPEMPAPIRIDLLNIIPENGDIPGYRIGSAKRIDQLGELFIKIGYDAHILNQHNFVEARFASYSDGINPAKLNLFDHGNAANAKLAYDAVKTDNTTPWRLDAAEARVEETPDSYVVEFWQSHIYVEVEVHTILKDDAALQASKEIAALISELIENPRVPEEDPPKEEGDLIDSVPQGAKIFIDGLDTGEVTPHRFTDLEPGNHQIKFVLDGFVTFETIWKIGVGENSLSTKLQAIDR